MPLCVRQRHLRIGGWEVHPVPKINEDFDAAPEEFLD